MIKFMTTFIILKNFKNCKSTNKNQVQDNITVSAVPDFLKVKKHSVSTKVLKNIKECQKECFKNHTLINKHKKPENDIYSFFYIYQIFIKSNK